MGSCHQKYHRFCTFITGTYRARHGSLLFLSRENCVRSHPQKNLRNFRVKKFEKENLGREKKTWGVEISARGVIKKKERIEIETKLMLENKLWGVLRCRRLLIRSNVIRYFLLFIVKLQPLNWIVSHEKLQEIVRDSSTVLNSKWHQLNSTQNILRTLPRIQIIPQKIIH